MKLINKKALLIIAIIALLIPLITGIAIGYYPLQMSKEHTLKVSKMFLEDMGFNKQEFYDSYTKILKQSTIKSSKWGHDIPIKYFVNGDYFKPTMVLIHWHETNHSTMLPLAEMFIKQDFNVVVYDQRAHGDNTAKTVTFGYYEKDDLQDVINFVKSKSKGVPLGVLGQSMGASTVGFYIGSKHAQNNIDFAIMESPFNNMYQEIEYSIHSKLGFKLPVTLVLNIGSMFNKLINGFSYKEVNVAKFIKNTTIPTLIMHSETDTVCDYNMGKQLYETIGSGTKKMVTFKNTKHVTAFFKNYKLYETEINNFIKNNLRRIAK
ncbi:alpha/beta hydrolase [Clostridium sp. 'deep sea']|uniref:alpha/beta hydrolase n=1 Tax=Clostridium sp. 'deep sea' TaxID=2779445 RepID=UPI0018967265|nr:alpha/beta fold hydrolase [Clostridium sp. 'deep sea']QOR36497.1 alpha/beta hydrolase [Clostridium sp. 'deep sea']